jgi:hypothetical protein
MVGLFGTSLGHRPIALERKDVNWIISREQHEVLWRETPCSMGTWPRRVTTQYAGHIHRRIHLGLSIDGDDEYLGDETDRPTPLMAL